MGIGCLGKTMSFDMDATCLKGIYLSEYIKERFSSNSWAISNELMTMVEVPNMLKDIIPEPTSRITGTKGILNDASLPY
jgi:hypothetical protein